MRLAARLRIPHSALLVLIGMLIGSLFNTQMTELTSWFRPHFSEIVVDLLLPILVFEASIQMDFGQLRKDLVPLGVLSVIGLIISTLVVGESVCWLLGIPKLPALIFGALISATDPIAVIALFKSINAPTRLTHLVEGESLINDGTAIVLFRVLTAMSLSPVSADRSLGEYLQTGVLQFVLVSVGGVLCGLAMGWILNLLIKWNSNSPSAQLGTTIVCTYLTFLVSEHVLGVSGVLATMTLGWAISTRPKTALSVVGQRGLIPLWELLALAANCVVFLAVGFIADFNLLAQNWVPALIVINIVFFARAVSILGTIPLLNRLAPFMGPSFIFEKIRKAYQVIMIWSGIRGGLALALVFSLPNSFEWKNIFLILALAVVVSTNLVNSIATPWVLRFLEIRGAQKG